MTVIAANSVVRFEFTEAVYSPTIASDAPCGDEKVLCVDLLIGLVADVKTAVCMRPWDVPELIAHFLSG